MDVRCLFWRGREDSPPRSQSQNYFSRVFVYR